MASSKTLAVWGRAIRAFAFSASLTPVLVGAMIALNAPDARWELMPLIALGCALFHAGANLISDAADYRRGVDRPGAHGGSGVLVEGLLSERQVFFGGLLLFAIGAVIALALAWLRGPIVLWLGLAGLAGGFLYGGTSFGYKYVALGDVMVFLLMGPLIVVGTHYTLTGQLTMTALLTSLPMACLVAAILHSNNLRDIVSDSHCHIRTLAMLLGLPAAKIGYIVLVGSAYGLVAALVALGTLSSWTLLVLLSLPLAIANARRIVRASLERTANIAGIDVRTAHLHLLFGLLLSGGILAGAVL